MKQYKAHNDIDKCYDKFLTILIPQLLSGLNSFSQWFIWGGISWQTPTYMCGIVLANTNFMHITFLSGVNFMMKLCSWHHLSFYSSFFYHPETVLWCKQTLSFPSNFTFSCFWNDCEMIVSLPEGKGRYWFVSYPIPAIWIQFMAINLQSRVSKCFDDSHKYYLVSEHPAQI